MDSIPSRGRLAPPSIGIYRLAGALVASLLVIGTVPRGHAALVDVEAGYAGMNLRGGDLPAPPDSGRVTMELNRSRPNGAPFIRTSVRAPMFPWLRIAAGYYHVGKVEVSLQDAPPPGSLGGLPVFYRYRDKIGALTLGPEMNYRISERFSAIASLGLAYIRAAQALIELDVDLMPVETIESGTQAGARMQGSLGAAYGLRENLNVLLSYTYLDLSPSMNRKADLFGLSLRASF